jgi:hypothetical protein
VKGKVTAWFVATLLAAFGLGMLTVRLVGPNAAQTQIAFLIGFGGLLIGGDIYGISIALRKTPIPRGARWLEGLRRSMTAYNDRAAWAAQHPWLMTAVSLIGWAAASTFSAARWAAYSH